MKPPKAPQLPNDGRKRQSLWHIGGFPGDVGLPMVTVYHGDWCGISQGKLCNCNSDITLKTAMPGVMHGHTSWIQSHDAADTSRADPRPLTVLYVGDYDPSGMHMREVDLPENRFAWEGVSVEIRRLAMRAADAVQMALLSFPASDKKRDTRYRWFVEHYGDTC
jgi:hypothetical protein